MRRSERSLTPRDQAPSAFASVLMRLCDSTSALAAAFVDAEGETVDYAAKVSPFDIKIAAAESSVLLALLAGSKVPSWPETEELIVRGSRRTLFIRSLEDGYALVLLLPAHAFRVSRRAVCEAARDIAREAEMHRLPSRGSEEEDQWFRVEVRTEEGTRRPDAVWLDGGWRKVDVLGRLVDATARSEVAYRARLATGAEFTLVREAFDRWYADALSLEPSASP
jgi:hypothetical protein